MKRLLSTIAILVIVICFFSFNNNTESFTNLPKGVIMGWGSGNNIPKGWAICNGHNGTPDLINRLPYGTAIKSEIGQKIGHEKHSHTFSGRTDINTGFSGKVGGNIGIQRNGDNERTHIHTFKGTSDSVSSIPPCTKIIFIMKL